MFRWFKPVLVARRSPTQYYAGGFNGMTECIQYKYQSLIYQKEINEQTFLL